MKVYRIRQEAIGWMAGGEAMAELAHDLRSPMSCVFGAAQLALTESRRGHAVDSQLRQILSAVETMDRMLNDMCSVQPVQRCAMQIAASLESVMRPGLRPRRRRLPSICTGWRICTCRKTARRLSGC